MYGFDGRVRYSEVGEDGKLEIGSIINYMQDCSTFQSEDIGVGIEYLKEHQVIWLMHSWQLEMKRRPSLGEAIRTETWAYDFKGFYGYRNFMMKSLEGEQLVLANSIWVFFDLKKGRPVKVSEEEQKSYPIEPRLEMDYSSRKIKAPVERTLYEPFQVRHMEIDTNGHVNNGQYIRMAAEYLPDGFEVQKLRAEYKKSAVFGNKIIPSFGRTEYGIVIILSDEQDNPYVLVEFCG